MSINDDGSVDLVSTTPITTDVYLQGALGYNNGVYILNDICKTQYSNSNLGATARSINLVDIENKFNNSGITARNAYSSNQTYGNTQTYISSYSYAPDIYDKVGTIAEEESKDYYTSPTDATYEQNETLTLTQTYYSFENTPSSYFDDSTFHELIFETGASYWIASRYAECGTLCASFGLRLVDKDDLVGQDLSYSVFMFDGNNNYRVRPVVTLNSNVKISTEGGTEENPREISL